jgi:excisionase family DNA binding protein
VPPAISAAGGGDDLGGGVTDRLLTAREVAELLGFAAGTIVDWAEQDRIPHFKIGTALRFRGSEILEWIEEQRRCPALAGRPEAVV